MPRRLKVGDQSESKQLETHLNRKDDHIEHVESVYDLFPNRSLLEGDVFESEGQTGRHDEEQDCPFEGAVLDDATYGGSES